MRRLKCCVTKDLQSVHTLLFTLFKICFSFLPPVSKPVCGATTKCHSHYFSMMQLSLKLPSSHSLPPKTNTFEPHSFHRYTSFSTVSYIKTKLHSTGWSLTVTQQILIAAVKHRGEIIRILSETEAASSGGKKCGSGF